MNYALDQFVMTNSETFLVQGNNALFTYQNIGNNSGTIQGSNDAIQWLPITSLESGEAIVIEHCYKYLRLLGTTKIAVNRGNGNNTNDSSDTGGGSTNPPSGDSILTTAKGVPNGVATLNSQGKVPNSQLPDFGGGSGGTGGINVIEYNPNDNELLTPIESEDFSIVDDTATWNAATRTMSIATPQAFELLAGGSPSGVFSEFVGVKLNKIPTRGVFSIDASQCANDSCGFVALPDSVSLFEFLSDLHVALTYDSKISYKPAFFMTGILGTTASAYVGSYVAYYEAYEYNSRELGEFPPTETTYPVKVNSRTALMADSVESTEEQIYTDFVESIGLERADKYRNLTAMDVGDDVFLELDASLPNIYFFIMPHIDIIDISNNEAQPNYTLNPTSQITLNIDEVHIVSNVLPSEAVDGDFLHVLKSTKILGKNISKDSFVQLYDDTSKMIVHSNQP